MVKQFWPIQPRRSLVFWNIPLIQLLNLFSDFMKTSSCFHIVSENEKDRWTLLWKWLSVTLRALGLYSWAIIYPAFSKVLIVYPPTKTSKMKAIHKINIRAAGTKQMLQDMSNVLVYGGKQKNVYCCSLLIKSAVKCAMNCLLDVRLFETSRRSYAWVDTPSCFHVKISKNCIIKQCKISQKISVCPLEWIEKGKKKNRLDPLLTH